MYHELKLSDVSDILAYVLTGRRKELFMRGSRWEDARRLNLEGKYPVTFSRVLDGVRYELLLMKKMDLAGSSVGN